MTDLADYTPGAACLAARERLLEGIMATWPAPRPKRSAPAPAPANVLTIDLDQEKAAVARLYAAWQSELAKKQALCAAASTDHTSPGDNYWLPEAKARARWLVAANFVEMLEGARR